MTKHPPLPDRPAPSAETPPSQGLVCPHCGCRHFIVLETRRSVGAILRRRECRHCGRRVTTREKILSA